ncbi:Arm DNA-binding domain-containing protein [Tamlana crocina]|uniref:Arm DNA-binding domain-containing protein n=1 Tax=Tamlana crocina TaxID=393006 RepID=UPI001FD82850|nr:Arm DNA-binding domain-containing protein [Tamlana crocina]
MKTKVSILFYTKRAKVNANGLFHIYTRITVNGKRVEMSTGRFVEPSKWSASAGKMKGQSEEARSVNRHLDMLKIKIIDMQMEFIHQNIPITAKVFKSKLLGLDEKQRMLIPIFQDHNKKIE